MRNVCKVFKAGGSHAIVVNSYIIQQLKLKAGEYVEVEFIRRRLEK